MEIAISIWHCSIYVGMEFKNKKHRNKYSKPEPSVQSWLNDKDWDEVRNDIEKSSKRSFGRRHSAFDVPQEDLKEKVEFNIKLQVPKKGVDKIKKVQQKLNKKSLLISFFSLAILAGGYFLAGN